MRERQSVGGIDVGKERERDRGRVREKERDWEG